MLIPLKTEVERREVYAFGPFQLDVAERRLARDGADINLTRKTFDLLLALIEAAGRLQTRESLIAVLWPNTIVEEHTLTWHLSALRRALGDTGDSPQYIETVRGHGYRFIAPVQKDDGAPVQADDAPQKEPAQDLGVQTPRRPDRVAKHPHVWQAAFWILVAVVAAGLVYRFWDTRSAAPSPVHSPRSIAVLPFENLSPDPANAYFASGMQDTMLTKLTSIHELRVVSRNSTTRYASHPASLAEIAQDLDVGSVLEGSVQKSGDQVQINVQLIDTATGSHRWAQTYTRSLDNVFDVQGDVAEKVAEALQTKLLPADITRVASLPTSNSAAYDAFLKADFQALQIEYGTAKSTADTTVQARALYKKAIELDPKFALAYARLSYLDSHAYWLDIEHTPERAASAQETAQKSLALDPDLAQAHLAMGYAYYYTRRDYDSALTEFKHALRDLPSSAEINASIANIERRRGQWDAAISGYDVAAGIDPRNPQWQILRGDTLTMMRKYDDAVAAYEHARAIQPGNYFASIYESLAQIMDGNLDAAKSTLATIPRDIDPEGLGSAVRFVAAWMSHDPDGALAILDHAPPLMEAPWTPSFLPVELLRAQALELKGDAAGAKTAYEQARDKLAATLQAQPDNPAAMSLYGLALAGTGDKEQALKMAQHAAELLPISEDAIDAPYYPAMLADVDIRIGHDDDAVKLLRELLAIPAGRVISVAVIENDPRFARVRERVLERP